MKTRSKYIIPAKGYERKPLNMLETVIAMVSCYILVFPVLILDILIWQFQLIYFRIFQIPRIRRQEYVIMDRYELNGLSFMQKLNCTYCGYVNGMVAFSKAVANQTEIYSCAIKHKRKPPGREHHEIFYSRKGFE